MNQTIYLACNVFDEIPACRTAKALFDERPAALEFALLGLIGRGANLIFGCRIGKIRSSLKARIQSNGTMSTIGAETRLKAAVIDRLLNAGHVDSTSVLISEMTVANWSRRADIVLANGKLWAFELKTEHDSLVRLPGQISTFFAHFEKVIVVVAAKFEKRARDMLPDGVGLWVQDRDGMLVERIRSKALPLRKEAAIEMMTVSEIRRLLACNGIKDIKQAHRRALEDHCMGLPASDIANAARDAVKRRFRQSHTRFLDSRRRLGTTAALSALRRFAAPAKQQHVATQIVVLPTVHIANNHPLAVDTPAGRVLKRRVPIRD